MQFSVQSLQVDNTNRTLEILQLFPRGSQERKSPNVISANVPGLKGTEPKRVNIRQPNMYWKFVGINQRLEAKTDHFVLDKAKLDDALGIYSIA